MNQKFTKEMTFQQALQISPEVARVFGSFNLGCVGCLGAANETLAQGASAHGLDVEELLSVQHGRPKRKANEHFWKK